MGEHAVVYGAPALVAAVDLRARAVLADDPSVPAGRIAVRLPDLDFSDELSVDEVVDYARSARERWRAYRRSPGRASFGELRGRGPAHVALVALGEAAGASGSGAEAGRPGEGAGGGAGPGIRLEVRSTIPVGRGFGSSAAVGSAVARAWLGRRGADPSPDEMQDLLMEVERRQHGDPSGVDAAAVLRGGLIWAAPTGEGDDGRRFERISAASGLLEDFALVDTGPPAENTGEVVTAVRERRRDEPDATRRALRRIRHATERFRELLARPDPDTARISEAVRRCQRGLEGLGVVPGRVRKIVRAVEEEGGAAKISGAGALTSPQVGPPGGGLLLVYRPGRVPDLPEGVEVLDARLGAGGTRLEAGG